MKKRALTALFLVITGYTPMAFAAPDEAPAVQTRESVSPVPLTGEWFISHVAWAARWQGTIANRATPPDIYPFELKMRRNGELIEAQVRTQLTHWVSTREVRGRVDGSGHFVLASNDGQQWRGRLQSNGAITGEERNGPEGDDPWFPFSLIPAGALSERSAATKRTGGAPTTSDWAVFLDQFKTAVRTQNFRLLRPLIADKIYLRNERCVDCAADDVRRRLREEGAWAELDKALRVRWHKLPPSEWGREGREILDPRPCRQCEYEVSLVFEQDDAGQWHWVTWDYPGD
ncbi:hypothetical protein [uncultured Thiodictyon sp.]|uniref:hypothetical protein n=1 Tax=uncultured Thiodictyon sp. TaxID=1846217 RepID=UPI0025F072DD|nr:hypothetical protein [uncultured Thiodictyon sp.]